MVGWLCDEMHPLNIIDHSPDVFKTILCQGHTPWFSCQTQPCTWLKHSIKHAWYVIRSLLHSDYRDSEGTDTFQKLGLSIFPFNFLSLRTSIYSSQRRRGRRNGEGAMSVPMADYGCGERRISSPSGVWGKAPVAKDFGRFMCKFVTCNFTHLLLHLTAAWLVGLIFPFNYFGGVGHPKLKFLGVSGHPRHPQWLRHWLHWETVIIIVIFVTVKWLLWKALETTELHDLLMASKPDFMNNPDNYFSVRLPPIQQRLKPADAEKREFCSFKYRSCAKWKRFLITVIQRCNVCCKKTVAEWNWKSRHFVHVHHCTTIALCSVIADMHVC